MSASHQKQHNLPRLQKSADPSGAAMPTSLLEEHTIRKVPRFIPESTSPEKPGKHEDPPMDPPADPPAVARNRHDSTAVEGDRAPSPSSSSSEEDEGAISSNAPFHQAIFRKSEPSLSSHQSHQTQQSHQTHQSHFTASTGSGPDFKDQVRIQRGVDYNPNNFDSDIVFAENVHPVQLSVTVNESHSQDEENAAPYMPPREVPVPSKAAPPLQEDGGRRCSKCTLIIAAVAVVVIIVGVVGGAVGAMSGGSTSSTSDSQSAATTDASTIDPAVSPTEAPVVTQAPAPVARDIAIVDFITSIKFSDSNIVYPRPISAATPEEAAVIWLIDNTNLSVGNISDEFRLTQKYALLVLYYATRGDLWTNNEGWLDPIMEECDWNGITCDSMLVNGIPQNAVTEIDLIGNNLDGDFPADIALLLFLQVLDLHENPNLTGQIPTSIGLLSSMVDFSVGNCGMSGPLPESMSNWTNLRDVRGFQ